jgi:hypothetical protein
MLGRALACPIPVGKGLGHGHLLEISRLTTRRCDDNVMGTLAASPAERKWFSSPATLRASGGRRARWPRRQTFVKLLGDLSQASWDIKTTIYEDDVMLLEPAGLPAALGGGPASRPGRPR